MSFPRRQLLRMLPCGLGAGLVLSKNEVASALWDPRPQTTSVPTVAADNHQSGATQMEKVAGIGGLFFRAHDPKALGSWYQQHLGINLTPTGEGGTVWQQEAGPT